MRALSRGRKVSSRSRTHTSIVIVPAWRGMLSFEVIGSGDAARRLIHGLKLFALASGLGGVQSLVAHPATMSHVSQAGQSLAPPDCLVRLSVGCEHPADLLADLEQALERV